MTDASLSKAIADCTRTLARQDVKVTFNAGAGFATIHQVNVPVADAGEPEPVTRGRADALALRLRYHDPVPLQGMEPEQRAFFEALEWARVESLGARKYPGLAFNLAAQAETPLLAIPAQVAAVWIRQQAAPRQLPLAVQEWLRDETHRLPDAALPILARMVDGLEDQAVFLHLASELERVLNPPLQKEREQQTPEPEPDAHGAGQEPDSPTPAPDADESSPGESPPPPPQVAPAPDSRPATAADGESRMAPTQGHQVDGNPERTKAEAYHIYTREYDEIVRPATLAPMEELRLLRLGLDRQVMPYRALTSRLAGRLLKRLLAKQNSGWHDQQEDGVLDPRQLARIITDPLSPTPFRQPHPQPGPDTVVSLLIDNSGSMRGQPIALAALAAEVLAQTLERCRIPVEILGFTTRSWRGGRVYADWQKDGKPPNPGRLNEVRQIIYKSAAQPWRQARLGLGLMLRDGLLKENIDGEALLWAQSRLLQRPERRRILIVLSDGAPVDDATTSANAPGYLEAHLRQVIRAIEGHGQIELSAIGIGHDVGRYYRRAMTISDPRDLAPALLERVEGLFYGVGKYSA